MVRLALVLKIKKESFYMFLSSMAQRLGSITNGTHDAVCVIYP